MTGPAIVTPVVIRAVNVISAKKRPKPLQYLAYLDHFTGEVDAPVPLHVLNPGYDPRVPDKVLGSALKYRVDEFQKLDMFWKQDRRHHTKVRAVDLSAIPMAVVDLTSNPANPRFAGNLPFQSRYPASIGKIGCMLGAYQLQFDLAVLAKKSGATTQKELFELARELWGKTQTPTTAARSLLATPKGAVKRIELNDRLVLFNGEKVDGGSYAAPNLEKIFDPHGASLTDFTSTGEGFPDLFKYEYPEHFPGYKSKKFTLATLGFQERMDLMIGQSHNAAAASCIRDVGFLYINSALLQSGIYDLAAGGLWVGASYGHNAFHNDPVANQSIGATPASLAAMFTLMAQNKLVNKIACDRMRRLLHKQDVKDITEIEVVKKGRRVKKWVLTDAPKNMRVDPGAGSLSYVKDGITTYLESATTALKVWSKLGIYKGLDDVAYVERGCVGVGDMRFVVAILMGPDACLTG